MSEERTAVHIHIATQVIKILSVDDELNLAVDDALVRLIAESKENNSENTYLQKRISEIDQTTPKIVVWINSRLYGWAEDLAQINHVETNTLISYAIISYVESALSSHSNHTMH